jgi:hypothetical protein
MISIVFERRLLGALLARVCATRITLWLGGRTLF